MNRKIEFRGLTLCNDNIKRWIYGYLLNENTIRKKDVSLNVIPKTIGQYIGLKDKNNKKIFEGDIMKNKKGGIGVVKYSKYAEFILDFEDDLFVSSFNPRILGNYEIIGNIYENEKKQDYYYKNN